MQYVRNMCAAERKHFATETHARFAIEEAPPAFFCLTPYELYIPTIVTIRPRHMLDLGAFDFREQTGDLQMKENGVSVHFLD